MKLRKLAALTLAAAVAAGTLIGCSSEKATETTGAEQKAQAGETGSGKTGGTAEAKGQIYYLNFKPEVADIWVELAEKYTAETGVPMKVQTAAAGTYEQTLKSEAAKKEPPTLFQINGPIGYKSWAKYCKDLKDTAIYGHLIDKDMAVKDGDGVYGIPYVVEGYGIIYNDAVMKKYFALDGAKAKSMDEIKNFDSLKAVVEDMQARKSDLGIEGVFASTSFAPGEDWRWQTHLANLPIYYEYKDDNVSDKDAIDFKYAGNFKNIFDLYIHNSCTDPKMAGAKTVEDSMAEFALGKAAMVQNGNWGWGQVSGVDGNTVKEEDVKFLPIYTGMSGEEKQGLCIGTENFFSINSQAKEEDQKASIDFMEWLFTSDTGKDYVTNKLDFIAPFDTFSADEKPADPLAKEIDRYMNDGDLYSVTWNFTSFPSQTFKDNFGASLLQYAQGGKDWTAVVDDMKADWANEKAMTK
ncbi:ABC transporter substrate-binding protein [Clostridium sp. Marseille-P2415]|uniref:ABC transporter substrate-binding protein n=1 Tax=Clostridium sp. Marseille-P2415 TaxID=1805471 RepID=UPI0009883414|nr:ABC transporter substrate-binding protein [Clostridium sp. Marseille-P2415]